ncbi:hypothetical protein BGZ76_002867 [Entomortierella beljakovae]|nr:hypothetical protein BGZ76_002867 [Entomortierella beljakovae]
MDVLGDLNKCAVELPTYPNYVVVGIDPGVRNTATSTTLSTNNPRLAKNLTIPQGAHNFTTSQYMKEMNKAKQKKSIYLEIPGEARPINLKNINEVEQTITPIVWQQGQQGQQGTT